MKISSLLSKLILENAKYQFLYDTFVKPKDAAKKPKMDFEVLKSIIFADPDTVVPDNFNKESATPEDMMKIKKVGKYTNWLVKNFLNPKDVDFPFEGERDPKNPEYKKAVAEFRRLYLEDLFKQTERLQFYEKAKQYFTDERKKNIDNLTVSDLFDIYSNFQLPEKKRKQEEKKLARKTREGFKHAGGEIIHDGDNWVLIKISDKGATGKDAAVYYGGYKDHRGGESDWCTSAPGLTYFEGYIKDGPLYVIFPQNDKGQVGSRTGLPKERYQFHFHSNQFMDRDDHQINLVERLNGDMSELKEYFKSEFAKGLVGNDPTKCEINYPQGPASKYIALYGYEELFNNLPDTIESLLIKNTSKELFQHPIPESISRFTKLQTVMMQNCVLSVPESISNCKEINFLSFPNNAKLEKLPESIGSLPKLSFINVKGCSDNLVSGEGLPKSLQGNLMNAGDNNPKDRGFFYVL